MSINKVCKTCHKPFDTEHDYATDCPPCYFANKKAKETREATKPKVQASLLPNDGLNNIALSLNNIASAIESLAVKR